MSVPIHPRAPQGHADACFLPAPTPGMSLRKTQAQYSASKNSHNKTWEKAKCRNMKLFYSVSVISSDISPEYLYHLLCRIKKQHIQLTFVLGDRSLIYLNKFPKVTVLPTIQYVDKMHFFLIP